MLRSMLTLGSSSLVVALAFGACSKSAESVCDHLCAKLEECGSTCSCDSNQYETCDNRDAILDHLDGCAEKACNEVQGCILQSPSCDGTSGPGPGPTTTTTGGNGGNGGTGAVGGTGPVGGGGGSSGNPCADLATICAGCTDPNEQAACSATAATGEPNACQSLLDDLPPSCT